MSLIILFKNDKCGTDRYLKFTDAADRGLITIRAVNSIELMLMNFIETLNTRPIRTTSKKYYRIL
jgi:hypothetical protein